MTTRGNAVQSVGKAMELLNCLAVARRPLSLQELALSTGWAKSTIHGLLAAMREYGVVDQSRLDGKYRLGLRLFELGSVVSGTWDVLLIAKPHLQEIARQTGESVHIGMLDRSDVLYLDYADDRRALRIVAEAGTRLPPHCSALGKAMLAYLPEQEALRALGNRELKAYTPHTITGPALLQQEFARIREAGYAVEDGEMRVGLRAVAAPIFNAYKQPAYAIGVTGMFRRVTDETFLLAKQMVADAAAAISAELGYREFYSL